MNIVVNLNKSRSITSHDAVTAVKKLFKVKKAGHAGTLDPAATGVLLVCLNEATKITGLLSGLNKEYVMTMKLGETTDTYDSEGMVVKKMETLSVTRSDIEKTIYKFTGDIEQIPPMHSAIKVSGVPLYELARKGIEIERTPRKVTVKSIEILNYENPFLTLKVSCSKGTYMRSLCNDIGSDLGTGAYITELVRTGIGSFTIENSAGLEELPHKSCALHTIDASLNHLPEIILEGSYLERARHGNTITISSSSRSLNGGATALYVQYIRLKDPNGKIFGIGKIQGDSVKIERLFKIT